MTLTAEHDTYRNALLPAYCDGPPGGDDMVIRTSTVGQADLCAGRLHWEGRPGFDSVTGEVLVFGTFVHRLIWRRLKGGSPTSPEVLADTLAQVWAAEFPADGDPLPTELLGGEGMAAWKEEAGEALAGWERWYKLAFGWPPSPLVVAEQPMLAPVQPGLWLAGTPDLILPEEQMGVDWKTANRGWPKGRADAQNQHHAYSWLANQTGVACPTRWLYVVYNRSLGAWEAHQAKPSESGWEGYRARLAALAGTLRAGQVVYHPKGEGGRRAWWCQPLYCQAWNACPARRLGDERDEQTRRPRDRGWPNMKEA